MFVTSALDLSAVAFQRETTQIDLTFNKSPTLNLGLFLFFLSGIMGEKK